MDLNICRIERCRNNSRNVIQTLHQCILIGSLDFGPVFLRHTVTTKTDEECQIFAPSFFHCNIRYGIIESPALPPFLVCFQILVVRKN